MCNLCWYRMCFQVQCVNGPGTGYEVGAASTHVTSLFAVSDVLP
jgi:hypothetical protein